MAETTTLLKVLLTRRHLQAHRAFCREYDRVAKKVEPELVGTYPSKAQYYRWLSGELVRLPYGDHCRILEGMFPKWTAQELFKPCEGIDFVSQPASTEAARAVAPTPVTPTNMPTDVVRLYAHRAETPKELWLNLLRAASDKIDLFANASLFLPEDNPEAISLLKKKAANGARVRILLGDPDHDAMKLRGYEERLYDAIPGRIRMALAYYSPLIGVEGIEFRVHGTSLYNSVFRYDDDMLVNQHIYGTYGYVAPILHLRKTNTSDLFDTYLRSLERVWADESWHYEPKN